jgi:hypothetical protein
MSAYAATGTMAAGEGYALDQLETNRQLRELTHSLLGLPPPPRGRDRGRRLTTTMATDYAANQSQEEIVAATWLLASLWLSKQ